MSRIALIGLCALLLAGCGVLLPFAPASSSGDGDLASNEGWTPVLRDFDGVTMVRVPPGCFMMGSDTDRENESPAHRQCVERAFWIDRTEVTNAAFAAFLNAAAPENTAPEGVIYLDDDDEEARIARMDGLWQPLDGYADHPVTEVTWFGARDFCAWRGASLPGEVEWEYAARGPSGWRYPWGDTWDPERLVWAGNRPTQTQTAPVGTRPDGATWVGALDMSGNVLEWTLALEQPYPYNADDGRETTTNADRETHRMLRDASWLSEDPALFRSSSRGGIYADWASPLAGFRCLRQDATAGSP